MNALRTIACLLIASALLAAPARAAEDEAEGAAAWTCESCPYPIGWSGELEVGAAPTMGATPWSGRYTGVRDDGVYPLLAADLLRLDADGTRWELVARDLGLDDRSLSVVQRQPGEHRYAFEFRALPALAMESARTPFDGAGTSQLTLPAGWVRADTTGAMTQLNGALQPVAIATERERVAASADWFTRKGFTTHLGAQRETKSGTDAIGGSLITRSTILPEPVDQVTDRFEAGIGYATPRWHVDARYSLSLFANDADSLTWDVPFTALNPAADQGRMALAPDNDFQQLALSGDWRSADGLKLSGGLSLGQGRQDDALLPTSITPGLDLALPRASAALEVATTSAWLRASRPFGRGFVLRGTLRYDERDVDGASQLFPQVVTDTFYSGDRSSAAADYDKTLLRVEGDWRIDDLRLLLSGQRRSVDRAQGAVASTDEDSIAFEVRAPMLEVFDAAFELGRDDRSASAFQAQGGQNPLLRYYDSAPRTRDWWRASLGVTPTATTSLELRIDQQQEDFEAEVGLTGRDDYGFGFDFSWQPSDALQMALYYQDQSLGAHQAGSASFGVADWRARSEDATEAVGLELEAPRLTAGFGLRAEVAYTEAVGALLINAGTPDEFPEVRSALFVLKVEGRWQVDERIALRLGWRHERFDAEDWHITGVAPDAVPSLLALGERDPNYDMDMFELTLIFDLSTKEDE